jgi:ABC-type uncharacterized transport system permease subunit
MQKIIKRIREPSTWAGLAAIAILFGIEPEKANTIAQAVGVVAGAVAVMLPEKAGA